MHGNSVRQIPRVHCTKINDYYWETQTSGIDIDTYQPLNSSWERAINHANLYAMAFFLSERLPQSIFEFCGTTEF